MKARVSDIIAIAADMTAVRPEVIKGRSRNGPVIRIRQACYLIAREQGWSYPEIGNRMDRDHSTVVHGCATAQRWCTNDPYFATMVNNLRDRATRARPFAMERLMVTIPNPEPLPSAPETSPEFDDMDLLSMAVASHYGSAAA